MCSIEVELLFGFVEMSSRDLGFDFRVQGVGFGVQGSGIRVQGSGSGCTGQGSGHGAQGSGVDARGSGRGVRGAGIIGDIFKGVSNRVRDRCLALADSSCYRRNVARLTSLTGRAPLGAHINTVCT